MRIQSNVILLDNYWTGQKNGLWERTASYPHYTISLCSGNRGICTRKLGYFDQFLLEKLISTVTFWLLLVQDVPFFVLLHSKGLTSDYQWTGDFLFFRKIQIWETSRYPGGCLWIVVGFWVYFKVTYETYMYYIL